MYLYFLLSSPYLSKNGFGNRLTLQGQFHQTTFSPEKTLSENLLMASKLSTFKDLEKYKFSTFGDFSLLTPQDITLIERNVNPGKNFACGFLNTIPVLFQIFLEIERCFLEKQRFLKIDFSLWGTEAEGDRIQQSMCLILHGGWLALDSEQVNLSKT